MAHNGGFYQVQGQQQPQYQVYQQPQNVYQQMGKPQPQQHLNYALQPPPQQQGFQFAQPQYQQPSQGSYPAPYAAPQTPYTPSASPYTPSQTPYIPQQTPYAPQLSQTPFSQPQAPYQLSQTPYTPSHSPYQQPHAVQQQPQYAIQQQPQKQPQHVVYSASNPPTSSFPDHVQTPAGSFGPMTRHLSTFRPPPVAPSATFAQQVQQVQNQVQAPPHPVPATFVAQQQQPSLPPPSQKPPSSLQIQTPTQTPQPPQQQHQLSPTKHPQGGTTPGRRPLPQPSPGANAMPPTLPPVLQRVPHLSSIASSSSVASSTNSNSNAASISTNATFATTSKPFPQTQAPSKTTAPPTSKTPSPTRSGRPLPTPVANKRATVDLGSLSSNQGQSSSTTNGTTTSAFSSSPKKTSPFTASPTKTDAGLSRTSGFALNYAPNPSSSGGNDPPKRRTSPPRFNSQPNSESSSPGKEISSSSWGASTNAIPVTTSGSSSPPKPSTSSFNNSSGDQPPKKFTPMWKRTIPEVPAPAWGYAAGIVSEPISKPKSQPIQTRIPAEPAPAGPVNGSPTKSGGMKKLLKKKKKDKDWGKTYKDPKATKPQISAVYANAHGYGQSLQQQRQAQGQTSYPHYQQPQQAQQQQYGSAYSSKSGVPAAAAYGVYRSQQREETEEDETEEEVATGEEEEETWEGEDEDGGGEDEEEESSRSASWTRPGHKRYYSQPLADERRSSRVVHRRESGYVDEDADEDEDDTPKKGQTRKRNLLRPKVKVDPYGGYEDVSPIGLSRKKIRPKSFTETEEEDEDEECTPRRQRILRRDEVEIVFKTADGGKNSKHKKSRSAIEERERLILNARQTRRDTDSEAEPRSRSKPGSSSAAAGRHKRDDEYEYEEEERAHDHEEEGTDGIRETTKPSRRGQQDSSSQWDSPNRHVRRSGNGSSNSYDDDAHYDDRQGRPFEMTRGRSTAGLPQPPAMVRDGGVAVLAGERKVQGGPRWKASSMQLKNGNDYEEEEERRSGMNLGNGSQSHMGVQQSAPGGPGGRAWPTNLPRLPRTPASVSTPGSEIHDQEGGYFDIPPRSMGIQVSSDFLSRQGRSQSQGPPTASHNMRSTKLDLDDPPPQPTVVRTPSPGVPGGYTLQRKPQSQIFENSQSSSSTSRQVRPQSQAFGSSTTYQQYQRHNEPPHHGFGPQSVARSHHMSFNASPRKQPQTPAPPPTIGIESPYPVGGRDKLADIPKLEEDSNDENDNEHAVSSGPMVPRINIGMDSSSGGGGGPPIPTINVDSSPRIAHNAPIINVESSPKTRRNMSTIDVDPPTGNATRGSPKKQTRDISNNRVGGGGRSGPRNQVFDVPGVSISGPDFDDDESGPMININGPDDHQNHNADAHPQHNQVQHRRQPASQQSNSGFGGQTRPAGGLMCGGCHSRITHGRIVTAMGLRWHPPCFKCTVCSSLLEHVSSYEHDGHPYCHLDYHESFAPRCYSCKTAIIDEQFISLDDPALGKRTYHTQHFFCSECGDPFLDPSTPLSTDANGELALCGDGEFEGFTVYKGYPYCEACHVRLRLPKCKRCKKAIRDNEEAVEALGGKWCWGCFVCAGCSQPFENPSFFQRGDQPYCENCFSIMLRNEI